MPEVGADRRTVALCLPMPTLIVVVLDACDDGSADLAGGFGADVHFVNINGDPAAAGHVA